MSETPPIIMSYHLWCPRHLEPLRAEWPKGYPIAMIGLFQEVSADPRTWEGAEKDDSGKVPMAVIQRVMNEVKPVCCWLPDGIAEAIIASALRGEPYWNPSWPEEMKP